MGPLMALGAALILGPMERFPDAKHVTSYLGLIPQEESSGGRQRFGRLCRSRRGKPPASSIRDCGALPAG